MVHQSWLVLALFVLVSVLTAVYSLFLPALPRHIQAFLGAPPPLWLIHLGLVLYGFSALVLTLGRLVKGEGGFHGWSQLGYLTAFYAFYSYAGMLGESFLAVFALGLTLLFLENYRIGSFCREGLQRERQKLSRLRDT
jgi:hypothetical protein